MPPALNARIAALMSGYSQLTPQGQRRFMEVLNAFTFASPAQRRQMRRAWLEALALCGSARTGSVPVPELPDDDGSKV
ncbi:hypothetical protein [Stenotrophomonas beteli]|uniref:hypothetical protein n=1 Tax=Stenotrophomonas beteli TaxID=3384461 RepID=UPI00128F5F46|nr:hypothetical protein [Stenotrophomonas maltophilia]